MATRGAPRRSECLWQARLFQDRVRKQRIAQGAGHRERPLRDRAKPDFVASFALPLKPAPGFATAHLGGDTRPCMPLGRDGDIDRLTRGRSPVVTKELTSHPDDRLDQFFKAARLTTQDGNVLPVRPPGLRVLIPARMYGYEAIP